MDWRLLPGPERLARHTASFTQRVLPRSRAPCNEVTAQHRVSGGRREASCLQSVPTCLLVVRHGAAAAVVPYRAHAVLEGRRKQRARGRPVAAHAGVAGLGVYLGLAVAWCTGGMDGWMDGWTGNTPLGSKQSTPCAKRRAPPLASSCTPLFFSSRPLPLPFALAKQGTPVLIWGTRLPLAW